ncbi:hypothetical protein NQZ68_034096 [Dissostichus eleginoides]|nr:hypothetical protein NQZ68_039811 [Dissostichus eleginoides]KAI9527109.1 hypothetical protein NQZ68_034096 [Dissostichus eleginoides]
MTTMMTNSLFGLEDMEALLWAPSSPMADLITFPSSRPDLKDQHEGGGRGGTSLVGDTSPVSPLTSSSLSTSSSPPPFYSPPPSPSSLLLQGDKDGMESDLLSLPWLGHTGHLRQNSVSDDIKEDVFGDFDWMAERVDLSDFDLDSLIPDEDSPSCSEDLLASLDCPMELDSLPLPTLPNLPSASLPSIPPPPTVCSDPPVVITLDEPECYFDDQDVPLCVPELEIKSEPASPDSASPLVDSPSSPANTLDLGSEVDVSECEMKPMVAPVIPQVVPQVPRIVVSLSPTRILLVLAPKQEIGIITVTATSQIVHSSSSPPPKPSPRSRPYPEPACRTSPPPSPSVKVKPQGREGDEKTPFKAPKAKKLKKMEQNKTAATRYRQKKRSEQETQSEEHTRLERKNMELTEKAESMAREIEYLKELMEEVRKARGKKDDP